MFSCCFGSAQPSSPKTDAIAKVQKDRDADDKEMKTLHAAAPPPPTAAPARKASTPTAVAPNRVDAETKPAEADVTISEAALFVQQPTVTPCMQQAPSEAISAPQPDASPQQQHDQEQHEMDGAAGQAGLQASVQTESTPSSSAVQAGPAAALPQSSTRAKATQSAIRPTLEQGGKTLFRPSMIEEEGSNGQTCEAYNVVAPPSANCQAQPPAVLSSNSSEVDCTHAVCPVAGPAAAPAAAADAAVYKPSAAAVAAAAAGGDQPADCGMATMRRTASFSSVARARSRLQMRPAHSMDMDAAIKTSSFAMGKNIMQSIGTLSNTVICDPFMSQQVGPRSRGLRGLPTMAEYRAGSLNGSLSTIHGADGSSRSGSIIAAC